MTTTKAARRAARYTVGGERDLTNLKRHQRRRNRRAVRQAISAGLYDLHGIERRITAYDVN